MRHNRTTWISVDALRRTGATPKVGVPCSSNDAASDVKPLHPNRLVQAVAGLPVTEQRAVQNVVHGPWSLCSGAAQAVSGEGETANLRNRVRARLRGRLRLTHRHTLIDVGEEAQLLIRCHGPLILVLAQRVEACLRLSLLNGANIHERPNISDVEVLAEFAKAAHLRPEASQTLAQSADLPGTLKAQLTEGRPEVPEELCKLTLALLLLFEGLLGLLLRLLKASGPETRTGARLLLSNVTAKFTLSNRLTATAKRTLADGLRP